MITKGFTITSENFSPFLANCCWSHGSELILSLLLTHFCDKTSSTKREAKKSWSSLAFSTLSSSSFSPLFSNRASSLNILSLCLSWRFPPCYTSWCSLILTSVGIYNTFSDSMCKCPSTTSMLSLCCLSLLPICGHILILHEGLYIITWAFWWNPWSSWLP